MGKIGYQWLVQTYGLNAVQPLAVESHIGKTRSTFVVDGVRRETYPELYRPDDIFAAQLAFALKYEGVHLELLSRLFAPGSGGARAELEKWIRREPTGSYARRAGFLCEWLHPNIPLDFRGVTQGNYVDALDPDGLVTGMPVNHPRWRVRDNLPGTVDYCPVIRRTDAIRQTEAYDVGARLTELENDFGVDLLLRSAVWLTVKESRASFQIEREQDKDDRVRRFAAVMETECGAHQAPLSPEVLARLQRGILGDTALRYGLRLSPVYVGHSAQYRPVVDYLAPHWNDTPALLDGLARFLERTAGQSSIMRAAVTSFGFVYIHPMSDGNGRISRFLINDVLRRDGAVPKPIILPVSATIAESAVSRAGYDAVLDVFSRPLMRAYAEDCRFGADVTREDGVTSNLEFDRYAEALPVWRYPDLTAQVEYMARVIDVTLRHEMHREAVFLRANDAARDGIKNFLEAPNGDLDAIIRSLRENNYTLSGKLLKRYPMLDGELGREVTTIVRGAFKEADANPDKINSIGAHAGRKP